MKNILNYEFLTLNIKNLTISFLLCSSIFFWDIEKNNFKLETLVVLLFFNSLKVSDIFKDLKKVRVFYLLLIHTVIIDLFNQDLFLIETYLKLTYLFVVEIIVIKHLKFISENLSLILIVFLSIFITYTFVYLHVPEHYCLGCFSIYREFYSENSHLGMIAPSIIIFGFFYIIKFKKILFGILYLVFCYILFHNFSTTLFIGIILSIVFILFFAFKNIRKKIFLGYGLLLLFTLLLIFKPDIYDVVNSRLLKFEIQNTEQIKENNLPKDNVTIQKKYNLSQYNLSLSLEVYLKSMISSYEIFKNNIFGVGFDKYKLNTQNDLFDFKHKISQHLNNQDASQNLSKGVSELGILFFYIIYIIFIFTKNKSIPLELKNFFIPILIIQIFIRGAGYFNGGFLISFLFIFHYYNINKNIR